MNRRSNGPWVSYSNAKIRLEAADDEGDRDEDEELLLFDPKTGIDMSEGSDEDPTEEESRPSPPAEEIRLTDLLLDFLRVVRKDVFFFSSTGGDGGIIAAGMIGDGAEEGEDIPLSLSIELKGEDRIDAGTTMKRTMSEKENRLMQSLVPSSITIRDSPVNWRVTI